MVMMMMTMIIIVSITELLIMIGSSHTYLSQSVLDHVGAQLQVSNLNLL